MQKVNNRDREKELVALGLKKLTTAFIHLKTRKRKNFWSMTLRMRAEKWAKEMTKRVIRVHQ